MVLKKLSSSSLHGLRGRLGREKVFRDEPYAFEHWRTQQTWKRYLEPFSCYRRFDCWRVLWNTFWPTVLVIIVAVALGLYKEFGEKRHGWAWFDPDSSAIEWGLPFSLTSFAVSLLLVFRTNESYRRWWEARRCIGRLCTAMRNIVRQGMAWFAEDEDGSVLMEALCRWCITLPHMMLFHVCEGHDMEEILQTMLLPHELAWLKEQDRPTFGVVACMTYIVSRAKLPWEQQQSMDSDIRGALQEFGGSDDILRQPIPSPYTRHTSRFLLVWLVLLPVAVWQVYGWATPAICAAISFFLLGIENIGIMIEEPFSVLPLDKISHRLRLDLLEMMEMRESGKAVVDSCLSIHHLYSAPGPQNMEVAKLDPIESAKSSMEETAETTSAFSKAAHIVKPHKKDPSSNGANPNPLSRALKDDVLRTFSGNSDALTEIITSASSLDIRPQAPECLAAADAGRRSMDRPKVPHRAMQRQHSKSLPPDTFWDTRKSGQFSRRPSQVVHIA